MYEIDCESGRYITPDVNFELAIMRLNHPNVVVNATKELAKLGRVIEFNGQMIQAPIGQVWI